MITYYMLYIFLQLLCFYTIIYSNKEQYDLYILYSIYSLYIELCKYNTIIFNVKHLIKKDKKKYDIKFDCEDIEDNNTINEKWRTLNIHINDFEKNIKKEEYEKWLIIKNIITDLSPNDTIYTIKIGDKMKEAMM